MNDWLSSSIICCTVVLKKKYEEYLIDYHITTTVKRILLLSMIVPYSIDFSIATLRLFSIEYLLQKIQSYVVFSPEQSESEYAIRFCLWHEEGGFLPTLHTPIAFDIYFGHACTYVEFLKIDRCAGMTSITAAIRALFSITTFNLNSLLLSVCRNLIQCFGRNSFMDKEFDHLQFTAKASKVHPCFQVRFNPTLFWNMLILSNQMSMLSKKCGKRIHQIVFHKSQETSLHYRIRFRSRCANISWFDNEEAKSCRTSQSENKISKPASVQ